jgi:hypothetical protein
MLSIIYCDSGDEDGESYNNNEGKNKEESPKEKNIVRVTYNTGGKNQTKTTKILLSFKLAKRFWIVP